MISISLHWRARTGPCQGCRCAGPGQNREYLGGDEGGGGDCHHTRACVENRSRDTAQSGVKS